MRGGSFPGQNWEKTPLFLSPGKFGSISLLPVCQREFSICVQLPLQSGHTRRPLPLSSYGVRMVFKSLTAEATCLALDVSTRLLALQ